MTQTTESIAIGCDHGGFEMKQAIVAELTSMGYQVKDFGTNSADAVDYPDYAYPAAQAVAAGEFRFGILICGSGQGVNMTANKVHGIRAALCRTLWDAEMARKHNDANILCLGGRVTDIADAKKMAISFLTTPFEGGRHKVRVEKIEKGCR